MVIERLALAVLYEDKKQPDNAFSTADKANHADDVSGVATVGK
jgi:hypothetical protein